MENKIIDSIRKEQCFKYAQQFGKIELKKILGSLFYTFEVNGKKTAIYCKVSQGKAIWEAEEKNLEQSVAEYKSTHKIVRLEIDLNSDNSIIETRPIITYDLAK